MPASEDPVFRELVSIDHSMEVLKRVCRQLCADPTCDETRLEHVVTQMEELRSARQNCVDLLRAKQKEQKLQERSTTFVWRTKENKKEAERMQYREDVTQMIALFPHMRDAFEAEMRV